MMIYLACVFAALWISGVLYFVWRLMNSIRLTLNNLAPGADYWAPEYEAVRRGFRFSRIDPALFNEEGQKYLKQLKYVATLYNIWLILGFVLMISAALYFAKS